jgi:NAD-dependent deacetylase
MMDIAAEIVCMADILIVVGTSLQVYPAAGLLSIAAPSVPKFLIDPEMPDNVRVQNLEYIQATAAVGLSVLVQKLIGKS